MSFNCTPSLPLALYCKHIKMWVFKQRHYIGIGISILYLKNKNVHFSFFIKLSSLSIEDKTFMLKQRIEAIPTNSKNNLISIKKSYFG